MKITEAAVERNRVGELEEALDAANAEIERLRTLLAAVERVWT